MTGATGWLGSVTLDLLDEAFGTDVAQTRVTAYASRARVTRTTAGRTVDVRPISELPAQAPGPTHIVHCAFLTRDRIAAMSLPDYLHANLSITTTVLAAVAAHRPRSLVVTSSGAVYDDDRGLTTDLTNNPYGALKHLDELAFRAATADVGAACVVPRVFSVAGPHMTKPEAYALGSMILMAHLAGRIEVRSAGRVERSFVGADEVMGLSLWLALTGHDAVFDTGGHEVEVGELAGLVAEVHGLPESAVSRPNRESQPTHRYVGSAERWEGHLSSAGILAAPLRELVESTSSWLVAQQPLG